MSTKSTLNAGHQHHLYEESFDGDAVFLDLKGCEFEACQNGVTVRIPLAIWEVIRRSSPARFDLAELSNAELERYVRKLWTARQATIAESTNHGFASTFGRAVWSGPTPEAELQSGFQWHIAERERQRKLRDQIVALRRGEIR